MEVSVTTQSGVNPEGDGYCHSIGCDLVLFTMMKVDDALDSVADARQVPEDRLLQHAQQIAADVMNDLTVETMERQLLESLLNSMVFMYMRDFCDLRRDCLQRHRTRSIKT